MNAISIENLTRRYGSRRGIDAVTLAVPQGSLFGFLGPNGAGKTTTIRVLLGFLRPTSGRARVLGRDCWRDSARIKADVGYLPGDLRLYPWMTGASALRIIRAARGRDVLANGHELAERFSLDLRVKVRNMSRGMRQKLGLIIALAHRPKILVLDEPTASLDPLMQDALARFCASWRAKARPSSFPVTRSTRSSSSATAWRSCATGESSPTNRSKRFAAARGMITIRWKDSAAARSLAPPSFLNLMEKDDLNWRGLLDGPVDELLRWLAPHSIADLTIGRPDLETLFRRFYEGEAER